MRMSRDHWCAGPHAMQEGKFIAVAKQKPKESLVGAAYSVYADEIKESLEQGPE